MTKVVKIHLIEWFDDHFYKVTYEVEGVLFTRYVPSITTKLQAYPKPYLAQWRGDIGNREADLRMEEAADRGKDAHLAWKALSTGGAVIYQPKNHPIYTKEDIDQLMSEYENNIAILHNQNEAYDLTKLHRFLEIVKPKILASEFTVCDLDEDDAGTSDTLMEIEGGEYPINGARPIVIPSGRGIFDLKTGNFVGRTAKMQVAVYFKCAEKMGLGPLHWALIGHTQAKTRSGIPGFAVTLIERPEIEKLYIDYRHTAHIWQVEFGDRQPKIFEIPSLITLNRKDKNGNTTRDEGLGIS